jgi:hypothetical protein
MAMIASCTNGQKTGGVSFSRDYLSGYELSASDERQVIALAQREGITSVDSISTTIAVPSTMRIVKVKEADRGEGRIVTYRTVDMTDHHSEGVGILSKATHRQFSADHPVTHKAAVLNFGSVTRRVEIIGGPIDLKSAETVLAAIMNKDFEHARHVDLKQLDQPEANLRSPGSVEFNVERQEFSVAYGTLGWWLKVTCHIREGRVVVTNASIAVA